MASQERSGEHPLWVIVQEGGVAMQHARIAGVWLAYETAGQGEPVVLIHGALIADTFRPLLAEPVLIDRYRLIAYRRRGYAGSAPALDHISVAVHAADCQVLLDHLGIAGAHVVGHSYGGAIALQLAYVLPDATHLLHIQHPRPMAEAMAAFFATHPMSGPVQD